MLASNKVNGSAKAYIADLSTTDGTTTSVTAGGSVTVDAEDNTGIYANSKIVSSTITTDDGGASVIQGEINGLIPADYTTSAGMAPVSLSFGSTVRLGSDFSGGGTPGTVYEYMGTATTGANLDLTAQDYTNLAFWKPVAQTELVPQGLNVDSSDATAVGGIVVLNDARGSATAYVDQATVKAGQALTVKAIENATITATVDSTANASGGSAFGEGKSIAVNATIATNLVLSSAEASATNGTLTTTSGAAQVESQDTSVITATTDSATTSSGTGVGITLAFNTVGWKSENFLFNTVDALLGDPVISEAFDGSSPANVQALVQDSTVNAGGALTVSALSNAIINATVSNNSTSAPSAFVGAKSLSIGGVIAENMVNGSASASITFTGSSQGTVSAGGALTIDSEDNSVIDATSTLDAVSSTSQNSGFTILENLANTLATEYQYTTESGTQNVTPGAMVRLQDQYGGGGTPDTIYLFVGTAAQSLDLGSQNYADTSLWQPVSTSNIVSDLAGLGINFSDSSSTAIGGLVVHNDARGSAASSVTNASVSAAGDFTVEAIENAAIDATDTSTVSSDGGSVFGGSSLAVNGIIATNNVLSGATATVSGSSITTTSGGNVDVTAQDNSVIDASVTNSTTADGSAVGVTLAFNTIGITPQNFLFNTVDALFGTNIANEQPDDVEAIIQSTSVTAAGGVDVSAASSASIDSTASSSVSASDVSFKGSTAVTVGAVVSLNKVSTYVRAEIDGSTGITAQAGNVQVQSTDSSTITSTVSAPTLSVAVSTGKSLSVAVGLSVARNEIHNDMQSFIQGAGSVTATHGSVSVTSSESASITASSAASAVGVSVSASDSPTPAVGGGGATALNTIIGAANAYVSDSSLAATGTAANQGAVTVSATDSSVIDAVVEATAVTVGVGAGTTPAFALGAALALNLVGWSSLTTQDDIQVEAYLTGSSVNAATTFTVSATSTQAITATITATSVAVGVSADPAYAFSVGASISENQVAADVFAYDDATSSIQAGAGGISITAGDTSSISTDTQAVAVAANLSGGSGGSLSIGLSLAQNTISNSVQAYLSNAAQVLTPGSLTVSATESSTIDSTATAVAVSAGISAGSFSFAASGAGVGATNVILISTEAYLSASAVGSSAKPVASVAITSTNSSSITADILAVAASVTFGGGSGVGVAVGVAVSENLIGFDLAGDSLPVVVEALSQDTSIDSVGALSISATASQTITASAIVGAAAVAVTGSGSAALSGAGESALNEVQVDTTASIDGAGTNGVAAATVSMMATDTSTISLDAEGASVAASVSGDGSLAASIGLTLAQNAIYNQVAASIVNAASGVTSTSGDITVEASEKATITATAAAASAGVGVSAGAGAALSGAGAAAINVILTKTDAFIDSSIVTSAGAVTIQSTDTSSITATIAAVSISAAVGAGAGVGVSIGVSVASNLIGWSPDASWYPGDAGDMTHSPAEVQAYILDSSVSATGALGLAAQASESVTAQVVAGSAAVAAGGGAALAGAGAGVSATNLISTNVKAYIDGDGTGGITASSISLTAEDLSTINALAGAAALSLSFSPGAGLSVSVAATIARNSIANTVDAYIQNAAQEVQATAGSITIQATEQASITSTSVAAAASFSVAPVGLSLAGAGVQSSDGLANTVQAWVESSSNLTASGAVSVSAGDTATLDAEVDTASIAVGLTGLAVGDSQASNTISDNVSAFVDGASITASSGNISVTATSTPTITTSTTVLSVSASIGGAGAGADSTTTINGTTEASLNGGAFTAKGNSVEVSATSSASVDPTTQGASGGLVSVAVMMSDAEIHGTTEAFVGGSSTVTASGLSVTATDTSHGTPDTSVTGVGGLTGAGAESKTVISRAVSAFIADAANVSVGSGAVSITATSADTADGTTTGLSGGAIAITALVVDMELNGSTTASVGDGVTLSAGQLTVSAGATDVVTSDTSATGIGLASAAGVTLTAKDTSGVDAHIGPSFGTLSAGTPTSVTITGGGVSLTAGMTSSVSATVTATSVSLVASGAGTDTTVTSSPTVRAYLGDKAHVKADGDVLVSATAQASGVAAGVGFPGAGGISAAAETVDSTVDPTVSAFASGNGSVSGSNVTFKSVLNVDTTGAPILPLVNGNAVGPAYATVTLGSLGLVPGAAGANVSVDNSPTVSTYVGSGATVNAVGALTVESESFQLAQIDAQSLSGGIGVGIGIILPTASANGSISAYFDGNLQSAGSASVLTTVTAGTLAVGRAGGAAAGASVTDTSISATTSPSVSAAVGANAAMTATNDIDVSSLAVTSASATADSMDFSFGASVGALNVNATADPRVTATIGAGAVVTSTGGNVALLAGNNYDSTSRAFIGGEGASASSDSLAASAGVSVGDTTVDASAGATVNATVQSGATIRAAAGQVSTLAESSNLAQAVSADSGGAALSVSLTDVTAQAHGATTAALLGNVTNADGSRRCHHCARDGERSRRRERWRGLQQRRSHFRGKLQPQRHHGSNGPCRGGRNHPGQRERDHPVVLRNGCACNLAELIRRSGRRHDLEGKLYGESNGEHNGGPVRRY